MANESQSLPSLGLEFESRFSKFNLILQREICLKLVHWTLAPNFSRILLFFHLDALETNFSPQKRSLSYAESRRKFGSIWSHSLSVHLASNKQFYSPQLGESIFGHQESFLSFLFDSDDSLVKLMNKEIDLAWSSGRLIRLWETHLHCGTGTPWEAREGWTKMF